MGRRHVSIITCRQQQQQQQQPAPLPPAHGDDRLFHCDRIIIGARAADALKLETKCINTTTSLRPRWHAYQQPWASAHRGKWGQLTPIGKMDEKLKSRNMQKEQFSEWGWRTALCWPHIYSDILQNAPFRSQIFNIFVASGGKGASTP